MSEWSVAEPRKLTFDEPVTALHVRVVNGTVNVVGTDEGSARLEVADVEGPPLTVTQQDGTLTVAYDDLPWKGFLKWLDRKGWRRNVLVSLAVPTGTQVEVGVVGATAVVSGLYGRTEVKGISGDTTLVGLSGPVRATTVSGNVEAQALTGDLRLSSVSGDLTVIEGSCATVRADSVSGSIILDLDPMGGPTDVGLTSVSGEIAIRLPHPTDTEVEANTASGTISNAFDGLRVSGTWGAHKVTGRLGTGDGRLKATTVTGSIALLRRPPAEDQPWDEEPGDEEPRDEEPRSGGFGARGDRAGAERIGDFEQSAGDSAQSSGGLAQSSGVVEQSTGGLEQSAGDSEPKVGDLEPKVGDLEQSSDTRPGTSASGPHANSRGTVTADPHGTPPTDPPTDPPGSVTDNSSADSPAPSTDSSVPPIIPSTATPESPNFSDGSDSSAPSDSPVSHGSADCPVGHVAPAGPADASPEGSGAGSDDGGPGGTTSRTTDKKVL